MSAPPAAPSAAGLKEFKISSATAERIAESFTRHKTARHRQCRKRAVGGKCPRGYEAREFLPGQTCCYKVVGLVVEKAPKKKVVRRKRATKRK